MNLITKGILIILCIYFFAGISCSEIGRGKYILTTNISPANSGEVDRDIDLSEYNENEIVELTAVPFEGYEFLYWEGDITGNTNPVLLRMDADKTVTSFFEFIPTTTPSPAPTAIPGPTTTPGPTMVPTPEITLAPTQIPTPEPKHIGFKVFLR